MTLRFAADENFNNDILRGVLRHRPDLDVVRVQDIPMVGAPDPAVLEWAASEGRVLLTHDAATMRDFARDRLLVGLSMPGVIVLPSATPIGQAIEELVLMIGGSLDTEWDGQIRYLPVR